jgi:hypothetical protein
LVTSIKHSPVLKGNFSCPVIENLIWTSFKRSPVLKDDIVFVPNVIS